MKTFLYILLAVLLISGLTIILSPKLSVADVPSGSFIIGVYAVIIIYALYGLLVKRLETKSREFNVDSVKKIFLRWRCLFAFLLFGLYGLGYLIYKDGGALAFYIPEYNTNKYNLYDYPYIYSFTLGVLFLLVFVSICVSSYRKPKISLPKIRVDLIFPDDRQWIKEIKERKAKGEKIIAYSTDGKEAAKRKARRLGIEDCFHGYKSEQEVITLWEEEKQV